MSEMLRSSLSAQNYFCWFLSSYPRLSFRECCKGECGRDGWLSGEMERLKAQQHNLGWKWRLHQSDFFKEGHTRTYKPTNIRAHTR